MSREREFEDLLILNEVVSKTLGEIVELKRKEGNEEEIEKRIDFILDRYESILHRKGRIDSDGKLNKEMYFNLSKEEIAILSGNFDKFDDRDDAIEERKIKLEEDKLFNYRLGKLIDEREKVIRSRRIKGNKEEK